MNDGCVKTYTPSIFESFNARSLRPEQVAKTFVPSDNFIRLCKRAHSLVVGPRGSGKTTLLKMLQIQALESWKHSEAEKYKSKIDFTGVFIPADRAWSEQIGSIGGVDLDINSKKILGIAAFTTHILRSLVTTMRYRALPKQNENIIPFRKVELNRENEIRIIKELSEIWEIRCQIPSFTSLRIALTDRFNEINKFAGILASKSKKSRKRTIANTGFLNLHFIYASKSAIERFNIYSNDNEDAKWAFLFDELEIIPYWISNQLIEALRSIDETFIFKLSISPYNKSLSEIGSSLKEIAAQKGHDFEEIPLWYAFKDDSFEFCRSLFEGMTNEAGLEGIRPDDLFKKSQVDKAREEWKKGIAYRKRSVAYKRIKSLAEKDESFLEYLKTHRINIDAINSLKKTDKASAVRKVSQIVAVRDEFIKKFNLSENTMTYRTRKRPDVYLGARNLFAIVEGNPRWFIGIIYPMINNFCNNNEKYIKFPMQHQEIKAAEYRFKSMLGTMSIPPIPNIRQSRGLLSLIDSIGNHFKKESLESPFKPDISLTFTVDRDTHAEIQDSIGQALNTGAIVYVAERGAAGLLKSLGGKRFRLSFLLAQSYKLPLAVSGPSTSINKILRKPKIVKNTKKNYKQRILKF